MSALRAGLGSLVNRQQSKPLSIVISKTGTDNESMMVDYAALEQPSVFRNRRDAQVEAMKQSGVELLDIPAFLRKQAD